MSLLIVLDLCQSIEDLKIGNNVLINYGRFRDTGCCNLEKNLNVYTFQKRPYEIISNLVSKTSTPLTFL